MKNTELTRRARGAASFKIIAVIYGGKWRSWLKRERVFKMRETMAESGARGRTRVSRDLDRAAPVFCRSTVPMPQCPML